LIKMLAEGGKFRFLAASKSASKQIRKAVLFFKN